ncbi:hypothetical protein FOA52_000033 [Chlamydomonas sp. UWO 241]|nr:hypothetical protein FOA52_000033 [Chlamydomonas sp. UWO 241]
MERLQEKRGPRVGDAASLWNFAPAPGWTREEAQVLKLCLMQYGVGQWQAIHAAGHLPGKLIQQLYGQTQRLLGQQSLAAFTGLQVDVDRVRAENETRVQPGEPGTGSSGQNVQRKAGLIIYSGPPPSRELKEKWRRDARERYGLTPEQVKDVAAQLEELMRQGRQGLGADDAIGSPAVDVMTADVGAMDREAQLQLLARLSSRLGGRGGGGGGGKAGAKRRHGGSSDDDYGGDGGTSSGGGSDGGGEGRPPAAAARVSARKSAQQEALNAALAADIATLVDMGFSKGKARDALRACGDDVASACEWLFASCA